jgi:hypothetical protein
MDLSKKGLAHQRHTQGPRLSAPIWLRQPCHSLSVSRAARGRLLPGANTAQAHFDLRYSGLRTRKTPRVSRGGSWWWGWWWARMGDTGLELTSGAQVGPHIPVLLGFGALGSAQVRANCYQNCYQAHAVRGAGTDCSHAPVRPIQQRVAYADALALREIAGASARSERAATPALQGLLGRVPDETASPAGAGHW